MSEIFFNPPISRSVTPNDLLTQVESLQTTLASLNQQVIILQEALQERDQEIAGLRNKLAESKSIEASRVIPAETNNRCDNTLTIVGALIKLYLFFFPPGKVK